ncbi:hypothetical protein FA95DRAFT_1285636 [Auriscalpium vulgare]|uniref:Uncharacterized protein n=1 Tax=Auriscalpium vulgare TaxID=40419 RepID=A0ACB8RU90_9AGAM|nr:hypothetical protein FA95DRAFT_1285636 [Auriscalpium vulgare]
MLRRKGHGTGSSLDLGFWAVRALKDEKGQEIGIEAGSGAYKTSHSSMLGDLDLDSDERFTWKDEFAELDQWADDDEYDEYDGY